jgi:hypothetical protein
LDTATERIVAALGAVSTSAGLVQVAEWLRANPDLVRSHLAALRACPKRLHEVAQRSYWHSNGFAKIKLIGAGESWCRLHVWPHNSNPRGDVNPHGHRWEFASWIAAGAGLIEKHFEHAEATDAGASPYERCDYTLVGRLRVLRSRGKAWLRVKSTRMLPKGAVYLCTRAVLHTVVPIGVGFVTTIVLQGPQISNSADVYRRAGRPEDEPPRPLSVAELQALLTDVDVALDAALSG